MKTKLGILFLCCYFQFSFGQNSQRKSLHGQIVNDSIQVDNGYVFNLSSKTKTFISSEGFFDILAKTKDTLLISGLAFKPKRVILLDENLKVPLLIIKLELFENKLQEVIIAKKRELNPITGGSQAIVDKPFFDDEKSSPKNTTMHAHTIENGMDFVRIGKMIGKGIGHLLKGSPTEVDTIHHDFRAETLQKLPLTFFTKTLKLKEDELGLFLIFCENDPKANVLLKLENEFEFIDFLIVKNQAFKRITTFEK
jgi:hypothetical protein